MTKFFSLALGAALVFVSSMGCAHPDYTTEADEAALSPSGACQLRFASHRLCAQILWESRPSSHGPASFRLRFRAEGSDQNGPLVDPGQTVAVVLWMPSMGHGSSPVTIAPIATGEYAITNAYFIMPGDWEIQVKLKSGNAVLEQAPLAVSVE